MPSRLARHALPLALPILLFAHGCDAAPEPASPAAAEQAKPSEAPKASAAPTPLPVDTPPPDVATPPPDAQRYDNGVASKLLRAGTGTEHLADNDCFKARFSAFQRDGSLFSSSRAQKNPELMCVRTSIAGLREPLKAMTVGEQRRVWVPGNLTFVSSEPDEPAPSVDLTFDLELLEIVKGPAAPADLLEPPREAKKRPSGLRHRVLVKGAGKTRPRASDSVRLRMSGFTRDGAVFESTELQGRPTLVALRELPRGLAEGIQTMVVGEKARFWIPAALAYGEQPTRRGLPAGPLVYDVELMGIVGR